MTKTGTKPRYFFGLLLAVVLTAGVLVPVRPAWAQAVADLAISKFDFPPDTVSVGETLFYELAVSNDSMSPSTAENVVVRDVLPSNTRFLFPFAGSDCSSMGDNVVTCNLGDLAPGEQAVAEFAVCPTEPGTATNTTTVESDALDPVPTNDADTETTEVTEPAVPGGGCLSQEPQPPGGGDGNGDGGNGDGGDGDGNGAADGGAPQVIQEIEQETESGDVEITNEVTS